MVIGIEATRANRQKKTGVEWYAYHLVEALKMLPETAQHSWLLYGNEPLMYGLEKGPNNWHETRLAWPPKYLWTQIRLSWEMFRRPPDALFVPAHVLPRSIPRRTVVTIHDVGFHRYPELYPWYQRWYHEWSTRDIVKRATTILTVSEFCKREIVELYGADPARIQVTPLGIDHEHFQPASHEEQEEVLQALQLSQPFFLFIGRIEDKKNVGLLVEAFHRYKARRGEGDPMQLVLAGRSGEGSAGIRRAAEAGVGRDAIRFVDYLPEDLKPGLLSAATAYIQPSWYEGFGLPPLEAMACGTPVLSSNAASLPEVVGEGNALFFRPDHAEGLENALVQIVDDGATRDRLIIRGQEWVKHYTWEATARATLEVLTRNP
jgi:glycosyltransferase involved in cell wall biosynthesis